MKINKIQVEKLPIIDQYGDMAEQVISKRVKFKKGQQRIFIKNCLARSQLTNLQLAKSLNINLRTLTDWKREKFTMSLSAVKLLSKKIGISMPKAIKIKKPF